VSSAAATESGTLTLSAKTPLARRNEPVSRERLCEAALVEQWAPVEQPAGAQGRSQWECA